jgi:hypothetical protein
MKPYLLFLSGLMCASGLSLFASGIDATATYTDSQISPGDFQYDLTLNNTGTTTIGTFWFSWVITPSGANGFLPDTPTDVVDPTGWTDVLTNGGAAIQFKTSSDLLASGDSLSGFEFDSTMTPAQLQMDFTGTGVGDGDPIATSFVYAGAPLAGPSDQFVVTPATAATPEPATTLIVAVGFGLIVLASSSMRKLKKSLES